MKYAFSIRLRFNEKPFLWRPYGEFRSYKRLPYGHFAWLWFFFSWEVWVRRGSL